MSIAFQRLLAVKNLVITAQGIRSRERWTPFWLLEGPLILQGHGHVPTFIQNLELRLTAQSYHQAYFPLRHTPPATDASPPNAAECTIGCQHPHTPGQLGIGHRGNANGQRSQLDGFIRLPDMH